MTLRQFNWENGNWQNPEEKTADAVICIAGDWAPIRSFKPVMEREPESIYGDLLPLIQSSDLSIVNLEAPLSDRGIPACKSGAVFKGEKKDINGLLAAHFDAVTLANNHIFDYGVQAFQDTLDILDTNSIKYTGAGMSPEKAHTPLLVDVRGIKIGIINFSEGEDLTSAENGPGVMGWDIDMVIRKIRSLKDQVSLIIVICHCGIEYIPFPPPYVAEAFQKMAEAGADLVIGHHPHVPQGISFHRNIPICHSLGNFVFFQETDLKFRKLGYMVMVKIKNNALISLEPVPYKIHNRGLSMLTDQERRDFFKKLKAVSLPLDNPDLLEESWNGFIHYWGMQGFINEMKMIMDKLEDNPAKGAAMFRNRLTTLQHYHHWKDFMTRIIDNKLESSPKWAQQLAHEWLTARVDF